MKEIQEMKSRLSLLREESVTEFDKYNIDELETLIKKRELLNRREERYYDDLVDF
jgi:hypothetical protein